MALTLASAALTALKYAWPIAAVAVIYYIVSKVSELASDRGASREAELAATLESKVHAAEAAADAGDTKGLNELP